jgi:hypothetical protein
MLFLGRKDINILVAVKVNIKNKEFFSSTTATG